MKVNRKVARQLIVIDKDSLDRHLRTWYFALFLALCTLAGLTLVVWLIFGPKRHMVSDTQVVTLLAYCSIKLAATCFFWSKAKTGQVYLLVSNFRQWEKRMLEFFPRSVLYGEDKVEVEYAVRHSFLEMAEKIVPLRDPPYGSMERLRKAYDVASERLMLGEFADLCQEAHEIFERQYFT